MYFQYDTSGVPLGFIYNGTQYFYITSQTGDIIAITEADGEAVAQYAYDEWGKLLGIGTFDDNNPEQLAVAEANPLRYRGYYYDNETGYYYLQSRYYDPGICRFINADLSEYAQMQKEDNAGTNLFAYCCNDPVNNRDFDGQSKYSTKAVGLQVEVSGSMIGLSGEAGFEVIYDFSTKKTYTFIYFGYGYGISAKNRTFEMFVQGLSKYAINEVSITSLGNFVKRQWSASAGVFVVRTTSRFKWTSSYVDGASHSRSITVNKLKVFYSTGTECKTYGVCISTPGFSISNTNVYYFTTKAVANFLTNLLKNNINYIINMTSSLY